MSQTELLWAAVSLMLLGALVSMCMKCQRKGSAHEKKGLNNRRDPSRCEDQRIFEAVRSYSISRQEQPKMPCNTSKKSKSSKHRSIPSHAGDYVQPRYQNAGKGPQTDQDEEYVEPISIEYYNSRKFLRPPSEDSSHSYQNIAGPSNGIQSTLSFPETGVYENSAALQLWQTPPGAGSSSDDEPDYVNAGPDCVPQSRFPA